MKTTAAQLSLFNVTACAPAADAGADTAAALASDDIDSLFGDVIHAYTRAQALEDGVLVDLSEAFPELVANAGFRFPVACTAGVFAAGIELGAAAKRMGNDVTGRAWDVLYMASRAIKAARSRDRVSFRILCVQDRARATYLDLEIVCGPGDNMEPVLTIMLLGED